jgi:hypothetical protein
MNRADVLDQFRVAAEIAKEDIKGYKAFPMAEEWWKRDRGRGERDLPEYLV